MSFVESTRVAAVKASGLIRSEWDLFLHFAVFAYLAHIANTYEGPPRQFPLFFLTLGLLFISVEILAKVLPPKYQRKFDYFTTGVASSFGDDEFDQPDSTDKDEGTESEPDSIEQPTPSNVKRNMAATGLYLVGFVVLAYFIGFLPVIPIYIVVQLYTLGFRNIPQIVITAIVLTFFVYVMFGMLLNVPVFEGVISPW